MSNPHMLDLKPGELVRVRSAQEIFATLDERGTLDGLPFMPEMLKYCGRTLPVDAARGRDLRRRRARASHARHRAPAQHPLRRVLPWRLPGRVPHVLEGGLAGARPRTPARPRRGSWTSSEQAFVDETLAPATRVPREGERRSRPVSLPGDRHQAGFEATAPARGRPIQAGPAQLDASEALRRPVHPGDQRVAGIQPQAPAEVDCGSPGRSGSRSCSASSRRAQTPKGEPLNLQPGDLVRVKSKREIVATLDKANTQPRPELRSRDGEVLRPHRPRPHAESPGSSKRRTGRWSRSSPTASSSRASSAPATSTSSARAASTHYWREIWLERIDATEDHVPDGPVRGLALEPRLILLDIA